MWKFCKYKHILGIPKEGVHKYRIMNIAIIDTLLTIISARLIQIVFLPENHYLHVLLVLFLLGIIMHKVFCVKTTIDKLLFG